MSPVNKRLMSALKFTLTLIPIALVGGFFAIRYQFDLLSLEMIEEAIEEVGGIIPIYIISILQTVLYAGICGFLGYLLADCLQLIKPLRLSKKPLLFTALLSLVGGAAFALMDTYLFAPIIGGDLIIQSAKAGLTVDGWIASLLYGGIIEEVMLRLLFLSLIAWCIRMVFYRHTSVEDLPTRVFVIANLVAAILFAAGHLPATVATFGELTLTLLVRCFLLNGGLALGFGWFYRKYGIGYAMLAHAGVHICSKILFYIIL